MRALGGESKLPIGKLSEADMKKMLDFMKSLADDDDASASKTSSEAGALSQASENSDNEDMFKVCALPAEIRTWESTEDLEQNRIARLAAELRNQPLLGGTILEDSPLSCLKRRSLRCVLC